MNDIALVSYSVFIYQFLSISFYLSVFIYRFYWVTYLYGASDHR